MVGVIWVCLSGFILILIRIFTFYYILLICICPENAINLFYFQLQKQNSWVVACDVSR